MVERQHPENGAAAAAKNAKPCESSKADDEMWFQNDIINEYSLCFPKNLEHIYSIENGGSDEVRKTAKLTAFSALVFYSIRELFAVMDFKFKPPKYMSAISFHIETGVFLLFIIASSIMGFGWTWNLSIWKRIRGHPNPIVAHGSEGIIYFIAFCLVLRMENLVYPIDFLCWQVSTVGFNFVILSALTGAIKYVNTMPVFILSFLVALLRSSILGRSDPNSDSWVRCLAHLFPAFITCLYPLIRVTNAYQTKTELVAWTMYVIEKSSRKKFITKKKVEVEMKTLQERRVCVDLILQMVLPKDIIYRLQCSNYNFSSVTDRYRTAFCIFIDYYSIPGKLHAMSPEKILSSLNSVFKTFDSILEKFPQLEKIKTISSKILLICVPNSKEDIEKCGVAITAFCTEILRGAWDYKEPKDDGELEEEYRLMNVSIGVSFGEIVAGIVGTDRFVFDVYGDTVNTASRMQTLKTDSFPIALCTRKSFLQFPDGTKTQWKSIGMFNVKGKGAMEVHSLQDSLSRQSTLKRDVDHRERTESKVGEDAFRAILTSFRGSVASTATRIKDIPAKKDETRLKVHKDVLAEVVEGGSADEVQEKFRPRLSSKMLVSERKSSKMLLAGEVAEVFESIKRTKSLNRGAKVKSWKVMPVSQKEIDVEAAPLATTTAATDGEVCVDLDFDLDENVKDVDVDVELLTKVRDREHESENSEKVRVIEQELEAKVKSLQGGTSAPQPRPGFGATTMDGGPGTRLSSESQNLWQYAASRNEMNPEDIQKWALGKFNLLFKDERDRNLHRKFIHMDVEQRQMSLYRECMSATVISVSMITIAVLYELYVVEGDARLPSPVRIENPEAHLNAGFLGIYISLVFLPIQQGACWAQIFLPGLRACYKGSGWARYWLNILATFGVLFGTLLTKFGRVWLCPQAVMYLYLSHVSQVDFDSLQPEMPFQLLAIVLAFLSTVPTGALIWLSNANLTDIVQVFAITATVLASKYQHTVAKRTNFLLHVSLVSSRKLQQRESAFFFQLMRAMLPQRVIDEAFSFQNVGADAKIGSGYTLEYFENVTVIYLDIFSFTVLSSLLIPQDLLKLLNILFTRYDAICKLHKIEKILTIGDAYVAMRLPLPTVPNAENPTPHFPPETSDDPYSSKSPIKWTSGLTKLAFMKPRPKSPLPPLHPTPAYQPPKHPASGHARRGSVFGIGGGSVLMAPKQPQVDVGGASTASLVVSMVNEPIHRPSLTQEMLPTAPESSVVSSSNGGMSGSGEDCGGAAACLAGLAMQDATRSVVVDILANAAGGAASGGNVSGSRCWLASVDGNEKVRDLVAGLKVRIGVFTGTAFGCLTGGTTKIKYELVGEAVDEAEKVEQVAQPGTVYCSETTLNLILSASSDSTGWSSGEKSVALYGLRFNEKQGSTSTKKVFEVGRVSSNL
ncbi:hypothetical protein HDU97_000756 [Phlyctochytrium planicorne]|nr:hypothetical protein HDU97_000756 [Phlyctochytrium planicorne]